MDHLTTGIAPVLSVIAVAFWLLRVIMFAILHTRKSAQRNVSDTVSDFANGPTRSLYFAMSVVTAVAWGATAATVLVGLPGWNYRPVAATMLLVAAVTPLLMIAAPIPPQGTPLGTKGIIHYALAIVNFAAAYSPSDRFADLAQGSSVATVHAIGNVLQPLHTIMLITLILFCCALVLPKLRRVVGLAERLFLWCVVVFYTLFTLAMVLV